jgi:hypothetical protein
MTKVPMVRNVIVVVQTIHTGSAQLGEKGVLSVKGKIILLSVAEPELLGS